MVITIIVIGQNEAETLPAICDNFKKLSNEMNNSTELIFIDSDSSDDSMSIVLDFKINNPTLNITTNKISGNINAAVGRNEGLKLSNPDSEYVFFLDGDIVFETQFVYEAISILHEDKGVGTVTGTVYDCYSNDSVFVRNASKNEIVKHHGGNFVSRKEVIISVGFFDESLVKHQDIDYTFRVRAKGYTLKKNRVLLGYHYTTHYLNLTRVLSDLKRWKYLSTGKLFRKYFFTKFRKDVLYSGSVKAVILRLFLICLLLSSIISKYFFLLWIACMCIFLRRVEKSRGENIISRLISLLNGIQFILGIFIKSKKKIKI